MGEPQAIDALKKALARLPGVGPKTAQRMAFHLLERDREGARRIAEAVTAALERVRNCERCNNFTEGRLCPICASGKRDAGLLCIVESPGDVEALERTGVYRGLYFVLMGHLSPLDGIGPEELAVDRLERLLDTHEIREVILATNLTVEGEATAHYLGERVKKRGIAVTRIAHGVPVGGELGYVDQGTLAHAITGRQKL